MISNVVVYSDLNQNTPTSKILVTNLEDIAQSITNILKTQFGERIFRPDFGSFLEDILHEFITPENARLLEDSLYTSILKWETRVSIESINIIPDSINNKYTVDLVFSAPSLGLSNVRFSGEANKKQNMFINWGK